MRGPRIIMVDIDDTVCDFKQLFCRLALKIFGFKIDLAGHDTWSCLHDAMLQCDKEQATEPGASFTVVMNACYEDKQILGNVALPGAAEALTELSNTWEIWYVTDRPEAARIATSRWLTERDFPMPRHIVCTNDKRRWLTEQAHIIHTVIDDRVRTLLHALIHLRCPHVHGLRTYWNSDLTDSDNVHLTASWNEIADNVRRLAAANVGL